MMLEVLDPHFMRFGIHSESKYFGEPFRSKYDAIALNGNLVAYSIKGVSSFLSGLISDKKYFIDPVVHAFGHHPIHISTENKETGEITPKASIISLAKKFGSPISDILGERALSPEDFNESNTKEFTRRVLNFQYSIISEELDKTGNKKYYDFEERTPTFLIAPYFYLSPNTYQEWLDKNKEFISSASNLNKEFQLPIFAEILVAYDAFLDQAIREKILDSYKTCEAKGILLWIEGFSEHRASIISLEAYKEFIKELSDSNKEILIMYGGYYSIMLQKIGNVAVCHGPGYGEEREVTPVGGGIPKPSFYYPDLHRRISHRKIAYSLKREDINSHDQFYEQVCNCEICRNVIDKNFNNFQLKYGEHKEGTRSDGIAFEYSTTAAKDIIIGHFIHNKNKEFRFVQENNLSEIIEDLRESYNRSKELFGKDESSHLDAWISALRS